MAIIDVADQYFALEARITSFQTAQPLAKRTSNAHSRAPKSLKWPHKFLSGDELARAGFFYYPSQANPDNVACFLCHSSLDGWEKGDDPLAEHLKHSPECGWAIVASINAQNEEFSKEHPGSLKMIAARKATFADKWPHENKKGWKCKTKQMVDAGWKFTPTLEYDDMTTCTYCDLALDGWEPSDKPLDEHFARSQDCPFFMLVSEPLNSADKKTKGKKGRPSKASRASTQSAMTAVSEAPSFMEMPAEEDDSILTTATTATSQGRKGTKGKKTTTAKGRKTKTKKEESVEVMPEPEDNNLEVPPEPTPPRANRGKKRKSLETNDFEVVVESEAPERKRRNTRTRGSVAADTSTLEETVAEVKKPVPKKGRGSTRKSSRKASTASVASTAPLEDEVPDDDEIDKALLADLERPISDDEEIVASEAPEAPSKKPTRASKAAKAGHAMFDTGSIDIDEDAIDAEIEEMEVAARPLPPLPITKGAKGKQPRKASARQEAAAKRAAEAEAAAAAQQVADEEDEPSRQISTELEHSIATDHSSPVVVLKGRPARSQKASQQQPAELTRTSILSDKSIVSINDDSHGTVIQTKDDSGNETDGSHSTVVRGRKDRQGTIPQNDEVNKEDVASDPEETEDEPEVLPMEEDTPSVVAVEEAVVEVTESHPIDEEVEVEDVEEVDEIREKTPVKIPKPRGRPKAVAVAISQQVIPSAPSPSPARTRTPILPRPKTAKIQTPRAPSPTPPPREPTPAESPQSSDAENHPPSSKPSATAKKTTFATPGPSAKTPLVASTPRTSPSKRNVIAGLESEEPWTAVDLDLVFLKSPVNEHGQRRGLLDDALENARTGDLTSPEKKMSVEEWIQYNAGTAEDKFREDCERMVGTFESEGGRAMRVLEGLLVEENQV